MSRYPRNLEDIYNDHAGTVKRADGLGYRPRQPAPAPTPTPRPTPKSTLIPAITPRTGHVGQRSTAMERANARNAQPARQSIDPVKPFWAYLGHPVHDPNMPGGVDMLPRPDSRTRYRAATYNDHLSPTPQAYSGNYGSAVPEPSNWNMLYGLPPQSYYGAPGVSPYNMLKNLNLPPGPQRRLAW